jgi:hypothetical protein
MVWLGGPRGGARRGARPLVLHDPPPGYVPPHEPEISPEEMRKRLRTDWILLRIGTVVLVLVAFATLMFIVVMIALKT